METVDEAPSLCSDEFIRVFYTQYFVEINQLDS